MNLGILAVQGLVNSFGPAIMAAFAAGVKLDAFAYLVLNYSLSWLLSAGRYLSCALPFFLFAAGLTEKRPRLTALLAGGMGVGFLANLWCYLLGGQIM